MHLDELQAEIKRVVIAESQPSPEIRIILPDGEPVKIDRAYWDDGVLYLETYG
jgi:hypothetical protein